MVFGVAPVRPSVSQKMTCRPLLDFVDKDCPRGEPDGRRRSGRRPAAAPQERGNSGARCRRPDIGSPTDDPPREGRERDFVTLLADYDDHGTLALAEIEQWSPRTCRIDERDFRSWPWPRAGIRSTQGRKPLCARRA